MRSIEVRRIEYKRVGVQFSQGKVQMGRVIINEEVYTNPLSKRQGLAHIFYHAGLDIKRGCFISKEAIMTLRLNKR